MNGQGSESPGRSISKGGHQHEEDSYAFAGQF